MDTDLSESAAQRLAAALEPDPTAREVKDEWYMTPNALAESILAADETIARDMDLGAALNSDKAERVLADMFEEIPSPTIGDILAALREGLADE